jgi:hypothetical protein
MPVEITVGTPLVDFVKRSQGQFAGTRSGTMAEIINPQDDEKAPKPPVIGFIPPAREVVIEVSPEVYAALFPKE